MEPTREQDTLLQATTQETPILEFPPFWQRTLLAQFQIVSIRFQTEASEQLKFCGLSLCFFCFLQSAVERFASIRWRPALCGAFENKLISRSLKFLGSPSVRLSK
ncbi:hypothetical protein RJ60_04435 [Mesotoga sp. B105.6.4]|nr:hypothetical protein RJ60_04435 [Mesotoga sp. B105.6.4]